MQVNTVDFNKCVQTTEISKNIYKLQVTLPDHPANNVERKREVMPRGPFLLVCYSFVTNMHFVITI